MIGRKPSIVVFDIGNVLVQWDPRHLYRSYFDGDEMLMEHFLSEVCTLEWNRELDRGLPWPEAIRSRIERFPDCEALIRAYDEFWMEMVPDSVPGTPGILADLKERGTPVYSITNFSDEKFEQTRKRFAFLDDIDHTIVSARVGLLKPEPEIYHLLCRTCGFDPQDAVFIDDSEANCDGAVRVGMHAHHFESAVRLRSELGRFGLL